MPIHKSYFSGTSAGLPPRDFLKSLPVRLLYLVFDVETDYESNTQTTFSQFEKILFGDKKPEKSKPVYFNMDENAECLCRIETIDYLTQSLLDVFPSGSGWALRWERHINFVTITFFRYFALSATSLGGETPMACLSREGIPPEKLLSETVPGGNINVAVIPHNWDLDAALHEMGLRTNNPFITRSQVFGGVAEVWMSFEVEEKVKQRPVVIHGTNGMDECEAGELIQVLLEIETYRLVASCRTPAGDLINAMEKLEQHEDEFEKIAKIINEYLKEERSIFRDLIGIKDFLPILRKLAKISTALELEIAKDAINYAAAKVFRDLAISRLKDLREKEIAHFPSITLFLRHRFEQLNHTYASIRNGQNSLSQHTSRFDGLLRTRMEARQQYSLHCVHFLILVLTVVAVINYSTELFVTIFPFLNPGTVAGVSLIVILVFGLFLFFQKYFIRKKAQDDIDKEPT